MSDGPRPIVTDLPATHAFFTREGGVSAGLYASLNAGVGSNDEPDAVAENRRRMRDALGGAELVTPYQIHSATAVFADGPWPGERPKADAVVTDRPEVTVGVVTADCGPVLFADEEAGVVGAAHAGWKGALGGVTDAAIALMEECGAKRERIVAVLGPTIGPASYEVDDAFRARFADDEPENQRFFRAGEREGHPMFDLPAYVVARLERAGVARAWWTGEDTYADPRFFSFRRTTHRKEPDYGRQLSAIRARGTLRAG